MLQMAVASSGQFQVIFLRLQNGKQGIKSYKYIYWPKYTSAHTTTAFGRLLDQASSLMEMSCHF